MTAIRRMRAAAPRIDVAGPVDDPAHPEPAPPDTAPPDTARPDTARPDTARPRPSELSFDDLYRASYARMVRLAWLIVGSRPAADDVVHDAFVAVHQRWGNVENPGAYLRRTVVNRAARAQRRQDTESRAVAAVGEPPPTGDPVIDSMWDAVERLRPERRTVIVLRYWADLPHAEIAEVLGCRVATVRTRLHRALSDLRTEVER